MKRGDTHTFTASVLTPGVLCVIQVTVVFESCQYKMEMTITSQSRLETPKLHRATSVDTKVRHPDCDQHQCLAEDDGKNYGFNDDDDGR